MKFLNILDKTIALIVFVLAILGIIFSWFTFLGFVLFLILSYLIARPFLTEPISKKKK